MGVSEEGSGGPGLGAKKGQGDLGVSVEKIQGGPGLELGNSWVQLYLVLQQFLIAIPQISFMLEHLFISDMEFSKNML